MPKPQPPQVDYSPKPVPWHRSRRARRWIALAAIVALVLLAAWEWGPGVWTRLRVAYWMRRCMAYTAPPSQVVYEEDPVSAQVLLSSPDYAPAFNNPHVAVSCPPPWREFSLGVIRSDGLAFEHERIAPRGPADPSHFTIGYAVNGRRGTIDGWLQEDERVKLRGRDGPAKQH